MINYHREKVYTFGIGIFELVQSQRSPALSVLGGKAYCVILAYHCTAARRFMGKMLKFLKENDRTATLKFGSS